MQELKKQVKQGIALDTCKSDLGKFKDDLRKELRTDLEEKLEQEVITWNEIRKKRIRNKKIKFSSLWGLRV